MTRQMAATDRSATTAFGEPYKPTAVPTGFDLPTVEGVGQRYQFAGREASGVGAPMYYRNRMYSAGLGRFGRRDPAQDAANQYNLYSAIRYVQALLGHESPDTTSRYLGLVKDDLKKAYDLAIDRMMAG